MNPLDPSLSLFTDASLMGWGAYLEGRTAPGLWSCAQLEEHINLQEMRAVFLSLFQFQGFKSLLVATLVIFGIKQVPGSRNLPADALSRSRVPLNHKFETYVSPIPDEKAWAVDAMILFWKGMFSYILPPFRLLPKILHKMQGHSYCSGLAKTVLVPRSTSSVLCKAVSTSCKRGSTLSIQRKKASSGSREYPSARLVAVRNSLRKGTIGEGL
ncbi:unnamed protein product [Mytilus edulis]|uniref:Uncharacterized protein n=1 Tax=Mytilus edulis TaxID=6550 RepID=A0A8S3V2X7_MYTED|nr:unnamed protein product [Mytilus edulis]